MSFHGGQPKMLPKPAEENQGWPGGGVTSEASSPPGHPWFSSAGLCVASLGGVLRVFKSMNTSMNFHIGRYISGLSIPNENITYFRVIFFCQKYPFVDFS